MGGIGLGR